MLRLYHYTRSWDLQTIDTTRSITADYGTIFTSAPCGVYFTMTNPEEFRNEKLSYASFDCHVEIEFSKKDPLIRECAPCDGMGVYFYEENINLDYFKWSSSPNLSWKANSVNWKMVLGVAAVGVGALMVGKVAYDAYQESKGEKKKKHQQTLLSLAWDEGVGKKGSRQAKKDGFLKLSLRFCQLI